VALSDLSSGLPGSREQVAQTQPDIPFWAENMMFALYDPESSIALMFHLGSRPDDWTMWHDQAYVVLPPEHLPDAGGVAWMWAYHRTAPERRPAGSNLAFSCVEPFARWRVTFDGYMLVTPNAEMVEGIAREGNHQKMVIDLDVEMVTPAFDLAAAAARPRAHGSWEAQGWADTHYQQLYRATGSVAVGADTVDFLGYGWRDHSTGRRGGAPREGVASWGGHCTTAAVYPESGRAWSFSRYWQPDGRISLEAGYVVDEQGVMHAAGVAEGPRLREVVLVDEKLAVAMEWDGGSLRTSIRTERTLLMAMAKGMVVGVDRSGPGMVYAINHGPAEWDGETGTVYVERSDMLNLLAPELHVD
jgi:hypothetical protein